MKIPFLLGRLVYGGFFLYNGINHFREREKMTGYSASKNVPAPKLAVTASGVALTLAGLSILLGLKPKAGALTIVGFLAAVSPVMHDFWSQEDAQQRSNEMINFSKNMALLGGALSLMGVEEPWPASVPVDQPSRLERVKKTARRLVAA